MNVSIRELRAEDGLAAVLSLCKAFFAEYEAHHEEFFDTDGLCDEHLSDRFLKSMTADSSRTIVALVDGRIVAYASIGIREQPAFYKVKRVGAISGLMVEPAFRRHGIATRLLEEATRWFRQQGVKYYTVYTATNNVGAAAFYRGCGMQPLHTTLIGQVAQD